MMYGWNDGGEWWTWLVMNVGFIVFWAIVIFGMFALIRNVGRGHLLAPPTLPSSDAEAILRERLARGEIDEDEYRKNLTLLRER
jgi:putative membrane protein